VNLRARGFTLTEIAIVLAVLVPLVLFVLDVLGPMLAFQGGLDNRRQLADVRQAFVAAYRDNALSVDGDAGARFVLPEGTIEPVLPDAASGRCASAPATFAPLARHLTQSASTAFRDGFAAPMCVLITPRLARNVSGVDVFYRIIAIVAPGQNGRLDTVAGCSTGLSAAGELTLCGDDEGVLVDGLNIASELLRQTLARMQAVAGAYQAYFQMRAQGDAARDASINYFASGGTPAQRWDSSGAMPLSACTGESPLLAAGGSPPAAVLGLSPADVTDPFGQVIQYDNCSNAVRNPQNTDAALQSPPYTAAIVTRLPGGAQLRVTAVGTW
jgi:prepilin-type N-terminal cleavage/methylation domain-containing protein